MIRVRLANRDIKYSDLQWSAVDPGGFETCSFLVNRELVDAVLPGDEVMVTDDAEVCWHGKVEEPGFRSDGQRETYNISAVGYGAEFKSSYMSMVYIDRALAEWKDIPLQRNIALAGGGFVQEGSPSVSAGEASDGKPALILAFTQLENNIVTPHIAIVETWYDAGYGNYIGEVRWNYETFDKSGGGLNSGLTGSWIKELSLNTREDFTLSQTDFMTASSGTKTYTAAPATAYRYSVLALYYNATHSNPGDWKLIMEHLRVIGKHELALRGTAPNEGFYPSDIADDAFRRSTSNFEIVIEDSVGYVIPHLVFRGPTSVEEIIDTASKFVGWHWGVWEPGSVFSTRPRFFFTAPPSQPTTYVSYRSCENTDITEKLSEMFNTAIVNYTLPNGTIGRTTIRKEHPRLPTDVTQSIALDVGTVGSAAVASTIGQYQLALLQDTGRTAGSLTLPGQLPDNRASHLLRPGRDKIRIFDLPTNDHMLAAINVDSFRVRRISVSVTDSTPRTQIEFDHGADLIEVLQARLSNAQEASNLG